MTLILLLATWIATHSSETEEGGILLFLKALASQSKGINLKYFKIEIRKQKASRTLWLVRCSHDEYANIIICTLAMHLPKSFYPQLILKPQLIQSLLKIPSNFHPHDITLIFSKYKIIYFTMFYK